MRNFSEYIEAVDGATSLADLTRIVEQAEVDFATGQLVMTGDQWGDITARIGQKNQEVTPPQKLMPRAQA